MRSQPADEAESTMPSGIRSDAMPEVTASAGPIGLCDDPKGAQQVSTGAPSCCKAFRSVYQKNSGISGPYYPLPDAPM